MAKGNGSAGRKAAPKSNGSSGGSGTLRSLRHAAAATSTAAAGGKPAKKVRSTASLTVAEKIAKRGAKPLVKGNNFRFVAPSDRLAKMKVDLEGVRDRREMLEGEDDAEADDMHTLFGHALQQSQLINLSLPFIRFSKRVEPYSRSLPLVLHYRRELVEVICQTLSGPSNEVELCGETILEYVCISFRSFHKYEADFLSTSLQPAPSSHHRHFSPLARVAPSSPDDLDPPHHPVSLERRQPAHPPTSL